MKNAKPQPRKSKLALREPGTPLKAPEPLTLRPDHPMAELMAQAIAQPTVVAGAIAQPESELSHDAIVEQPAIVQPAIAPDRFTVVPNDIFDKLLPNLHVYDQSVMMRLYRLSRGHHKDTCTVGYGTLAKACNISTRQAQISIERLIGLNLIKRIDVNQRAAVRQQRGSIYKVNLPAAKLAPSTKAQGTIASSAIAGRANNKYKDQKEIDKREETRCDKCRETGGFLYPNGIGGGGVIRCDHS